MGGHPSAFITLCKELVSPLKEMGEVTNVSGLILWLKIWLYDFVFTRLLKGEEETVDFTSLFTSSYCILRICSFFLFEESTLLKLSSKAIWQSKSLLHLSCILFEQQPVPICQPNWFNLPQSEMGLLFCGNRSPHGRKAGSTAEDLDVQPASAADKQFLSPMTQQNALSNGRKPHSFTFTTSDLLF